jgi:hypothetical protein
MPFLDPPEILCSGSSAIDSETLRNIYRLYSACMERGTPSKSFLKENPQYEMH